MNIFNNLAIIGALTFAVSPILGGALPPSPGINQGVADASPAINTDTPAKLTSALREAGIDDGKFASVMVHILEVEGGFSDHPADRGGATKYGIIAERAREHGLSVYSLTLAQALKIYYSDYWLESGASKHPSPLDLAVMNSYVNSGKRWSIVGRSPREQALNYISQQDAYYRKIIARDPSQAVFGKGWGNRSEYMRKVINSSS